MENKFCEYKNLKLGKDKPEVVTEEEVNNELKRLLEKNIKFVTKEDSSALHDVVNIDYEGFVDGVAFEGGKGEKYDLELGSNTFIPGFEDQLVGYKKGDKVDVKVTFPSDYHAEELKGKEAIFKCVINEVKQKEESLLDDDFAKTFGIPTKEDLIAALRSNLEQRNDLASKNDYIKKLCDYLAENSTIAIEEEELNARIDEIISYYENMIKQYGMSMDQYLSMTGTTKEDFRKSLANDVSTSIKIDRVYEHVAQSENFEISEEEFNDYLDYLKNYYGASDEQFAEYQKQKEDEIKKEYLRQKISQFLYENND